MAAIGAGSGGLRCFCVDYIRGIYLPRYRGIIGVRWHTQPELRADAFFLLVHRANWL